MHNTPIVILNRDRLSSTRRMVDHLLSLNYDNLHILDAGSSYKPLLEYYKSCPAEVIMADNIGHKGFWSAGYIDKFRDFPWVAVTDSDITLNPATPKDFIEQMIVVAKDFRMEKVGLAIQYDDITNLHLRPIIEPIEKNYWRQRLQHSLPCYPAPVDTTFHICRPDRPFMYQAIRVAGDFTCTHGDWYSDWSNLTEEEQYYFEHADETISTTKQHFLRYLLTV